MRGHLIRGSSGLGGAAPSLAVGILGGRLPDDVLDPDPTQREGRAEPPFVGDLGDEAEALQLGQRLGVNPPAPLLGHERGGVGVERRGEQVRAVGRQRVQGGGAEALGVLVEEHRPQPELGALLQERGEVARGRTVIALHLVEEDPERLAPLGRELGPPARGVQQVEEQQVGDQPVAGAARSPGRRGRSCPRPSPRGPGRCSGSGRAAP